MKENQIEDCDLNLESINLLNTIAALKFIYSTNQGSKRQKNKIYINCLGFSRTLVLIVRKIIGSGMSVN